MKQTTRKNREIQARTIQDKHGNSMTDPKKEMKRFMVSEAEVYNKEDQSTRISKIVRNTEVEATLNYNKRRI